MLNLQNCPGPWRLTGPKQAPDLQSAGIQAPVPDAKIKVVIQPTSASCVGWMSQFDEREEVGTVCHTQDTHIPPSF